MCVCVCVCFVEVEVEGCVSYPTTSHGSLALRFFGVSFRFQVPSALSTAAAAATTTDRFLFF